MRDTSTGNYRSGRVSASMNKKNKAARLAAIKRIYRKMAGRASELEPESDDDDDPVEDSEPDTLDLLHA